MARKLYRSDPWGTPEKSIAGGQNSRSHEKDFSDKPSWLDMVPVKKYKYFTLFLKICPNGETYHECFMNREIDLEKVKRGHR